MADNQRRRKYIDSKVQGQLAVRTLLHWVTLLLVSCIVSLGLQFLLNPLATWRENARQMWSSQGPIVLVAFALFPIFVRDTISFSHRFVGPILRIRSVLRDLAAGKSVEPIQLRPNDYWLEIADELNRVVAEVERLKLTAASTPRSESVAPCNEQTTIVAGQV